MLCPVQLRPLDSGRQGKGNSADSCGRERSICCFACDGVAVKSTPILNVFHNELYIYALYVSILYEDFDVNISLLVSLQCANV